MENKKIPKILTLAENKKYLMMDHQEKFFNSVKSQWESKGLISKRQEEILEKIIDQCHWFAQGCRSIQSRCGFDD